MLASVAVEFFGGAFQTLVNWAAVARRFESNRRRVLLPFEPDVEDENRSPFRFAYHDAGDPGLPLPDAGTYEPQ